MKTYLTNDIHDSLKSITTMPVCLTRSFTFNASARRVEIFRIIGALIPPPFHQQPLGSSNGGPQTLLKVKSMHKFCFPCFSLETLHNINYRTHFIAVVTSKANSIHELSLIGFD